MSAGDHSSSLKKVRSLLRDSEFGITNINPDIKKGTKRVTRAIQPVVKAVVTESNDSSDIRELKKKHKMDISTLEKDISSLQLNIQEIKREMKNEQKELNEEITQLKSSDTTLAAEMQVRIQSLSEKYSSEISKMKYSISSLSQQMQEIKKEIPERVDIDSLRSEFSSMHTSEIERQRREIEEQKRMINDLSSSMRELNKIVSKNAMNTASIAGEVVNSTMKSLHIGDKFNLPEQPQVQREGGIHKNAPLALTVNGAVLFHDIGYTTDKKSLVPLYYDPITNRVLFYKGK